MPQINFAKGDVVGFRRLKRPQSGDIGSHAEYLIWEIECVEKFGWGPFQIKDTMEDRNGVQLHVMTSDGEEAIFPARWFMLWEQHPHQNTHT